MSPSIKNNKKSTSLTTAAATTPRTRAITLQRYTKASLTPSAATSLSSTKSSNSSALLTSNVDFVSSSSSTPSSSLFAEQAELTIKAKVTPTTAAVQPISGGRKISSRITTRTSSGISFPTFKIMSYPNIIALLTVLVCGLVTVNGLKCYMCGQYNEGVGSITPCLNYSEQYAHLYLKECSKKSEKYCVKYVSELSIVRDCATECAEKEIWETQTYCCPEDGCNGSSTLEAPVVAILLPLMFYIVNEVLNIMKQRR